MTDHTDPGKRSAVATLPVLLGPANTLAAIGLPYRWLRDTADRLGVPYVAAGRKRAYRADLVIAALERHSVTPETETASARGTALPISENDSMEAIRRMFGVRLRSGER